MRRLISSWTSTLSKLGYQPRRRRKSRQSGYNHRSGVELLESRELLSNSPWAGSDRIVADFDGDGNPDRLGSLSAAGTQLDETWYVDTKASATAATTEAWSVTRGDGAPIAWTIPQPQYYRVGDFNGDGRDDILGRETTGPWYVIESRGPTTVGPNSYSGEFVISTWGAWGTSGDWSQPIIGDYDGDGRDDLAAFTAPGALRVARSAGDKFEADVLWAQPTITPATSSIASGDFNGDGRDDLWFKKSGTNNWAIAVSDGARFNIVDPTVAVTTSASTTYKGDFDGDRADELIGWNSTAGRWDLLDYTDQGGAQLQTSWGNALGGFTNLHIGDANRDGRYDLVAYDSAGAGNWKVALSQLQSNGTIAFVIQTVQTSGEADWNRWLNDWDWGPTGHEYISIDAAYQGFLDEFSSVYNTVELEFHPGFMKSPTTTIDTEAGNPWEQAALLVEKLEALGFDADIATGPVWASFADVTSWIGAKDSYAAYWILKSAFDHDAAYDIAIAHHFRTAAGV